MEQEKHSRDGYFIVGEGVQGTMDAPPDHGGHVLMEADLRAFRFSRIGPKGRALPEPLRRKLAAAMTRDDNKPDSVIPAGYTYLGQFLDHDLTFDKSRLRDSGTVSVADLQQGRSPSLDLDSLYGLGPVRTPDFYAADKVRLKVGATSESGPGVEQPQPGFDLPRTASDGPLIPDKRNDENLAVGQTHLAFIRFHNRVADKLAADGVPAGELFEKTRDLVVRHYQWMIRTDFLPRIVKPAIVNAVFANGRKVFERNPPGGASPTMPVEFSVAAYRMGHSMVRRDYDWNRIFDDGAGSLGLLFNFSGTGGGLTNANRLPSNWIADFRRLYQFAKDANRPDLRPVVGGRNKLNFARRINTLLADPLADLPDGSIGGPDPKAHRHNLAFRNLTRAGILELASGQQMAALMRKRGVATASLTRAQILNGNGGAKLDGPGGLNAAQRDLLARHTPLWFYVLREAELNAGKLAGVGGRLVAETFHRSIEGSLTSIVADPAWRPTLGPDANTFRMVDLLLFAFEGKAALLNPLG